MGSLWPATELHLGTIGWLRPIEHGWLILQQKVQATPLPKYVSTYEVQQNNTVAHTTVSQQDSWSTAIYTKV